MSQDPQEQAMPFGKKNYILLIVGIAVIFFGYFLMTIEDFIDATKFSLALYVAPPVIILGFIVCIYSIMVKSDKKDNVQE